MNASLDEKLRNVKWGKFKFKEVFNRIEQGRRLKKDDQIDGTIPFVMSGTANAGVVNYISNPVASFPKNAITIDIFGNTFYRNYAFGAGDDTGVYRNDATVYSSNAMLFFAVAMQKSMMGRFSYGKKLRSSQSENFTMHLPMTDDGEIDFAFMESFIAELEAERVQELEAYLKASGFDNYELSEWEENAIKAVDTVNWGEFLLGDLFEVVSYRKRFDSNKVTIVENGGHPYIVRQSTKNGKKGNIDEPVEYLNPGNTISFGQDTATMFYQEKPYFTGDKIKILKPKCAEFSKDNAQFFLSAMTKVFSTFAWGASMFNVEILKKQIVLLPIKNDGSIDFNFMETLISAIQKLVIKDVVKYADSKISATKEVISK